MAKEKFSNAKVSELLNEILENELGKKRELSGKIRETIEKDVRKAWNVEKLIAALEDLGGKDSVSFSPKADSKYGKDRVLRMQSAGLNIDRYGHLNDDINYTELADFRLQWKIKIVALESGVDVAKLINDFKSSLAGFLKEQ